MGDPHVLTVVIPIRTVPGLNAREHWAVKAKRVATERDMTSFVLRATLRCGLMPKPPLRILLTRISPRGKCDDDNLSGACKATRDEVAAQLGIDDGDTTAATWEYAQMRGPWGIRVDILQVEP